jgi:fermentation-respiration switch protein FrsA (DUF1100 family)
MKKMRKVHSSPHLSSVEMLKKWVKKNKKDKDKPATENNLDYDRDGLGGAFNLKPVIIFCLPFIPVLVYALLFFFSSLFLIGYLMFIMLYFSIIVAYCITEIALKPPWYQPTHHSKGLTMLHIPDYWQGICHNPKQDLNLDYEDVEFPTKNGLILRGWYIPALNPKPQLAVIGVHGGGRDRRALLRHAPIFYEQGWPVLLFDLSEHGTSDGSRKGFSYGVREQHDVSAAARFLKETYGINKIVAFGTSVGASSVILAAAVDKEIDIVIAENAIADPGEWALFHVERLVETYTPPWFSRVVLWPFWQLITAMFLIRIGAWFTKGVAAVNMAEKISPRPLFLLHGTQDDLVPVSHSERIHDRAKEPKGIWIAEDAWHCALYDKYPSVFKEKVVGFIKEHAGKSASEKKSQ